MNNDTRTNATKCEPTIPDLPPGAPHNTREVLGDPGDGEGGGGGRRWMREGTRCGSRRNEETGWIGVRDGQNGQTCKNGRMERLDRLE